MPPPSTASPTEKSPGPSGGSLPGKRLHTHTHTHPARPGWDGTGAPRIQNEAPRRCPSEPRTCGAEPPERHPRHSPDRPGGGGPRRPVGRSRPEFDREGVSVPEADVSIWMGVISRGRPSQATAGSTHPTPPSPMQPKREDREQAAPCQSPAPSARGMVHPESRTPAAPASPAGEAPRGTRHGDYLEWQRSSAAGLSPRPA